MQRTVQDVMTRDVVIARPTTPYKELVRLLTEHRIAALPVVDDAGHPVGIVSETDLTAQQGAELHPDAHVTAAYVMTTAVVTAHPEMPITEAARLMRDRKVKRLPVADAAGTLAGIVAQADLLKVFLRPDDEIRFEIIDRAIHDLPGLDVADLRLEARDGEVTLGGRVQTKRQAIRLRELADEAEGVIAVHDRLAFDLDDSREPAPMD